MCWKFVSWECCVMYIGQAGENQIELLVEGYQNPDAAQN